jgi:hypothetical protein
VKSPLRPLLAALLFAAAALFGSTSAFAAPDDALDRLTTFLAGHFSSAEQAAADKNFRSVVLHVARIWPQRSDGPWLYVEQALADAPEQPYRQRVYQLAHREDGVLESRVFTIADPVAATGAWKKPLPLSELSPANLSARDGCTVFLREMPDGSFVGRTEGNGCASDLRGASYATSEVTLTATEMVSWDRGYNAAGRQVWGSTAGGYRFKRLATP